MSAWFPWTSESKVMLDFCSEATGACVIDTRESQMLPLIGPWMLPSEERMLVVDPKV